VKLATVCVMSAFTLIGACSNERPSTAALVSCPTIHLADRPHPAGKGIVIKILSQSEAMALLSKTQNIVGRPIDAAYVNNVRAIIKAEDGTSKTILIPYDMMIVVGDRVLFQSAYVSPHPLCSYVPNLATSKI